MKELIPNESQYPHLAEFLRSGGKLVIGEDRDLGSFAHIQMDRETRTYGTMDYDDLAHALKAMDQQAKNYIDEHW